MAFKTTIGDILNIASPSMNMRVVFCDGEKLEGRAIEIQAAIEKENYLLLSLEVEYITMRGDTLVMYC